MKRDPERPTTEHLQYLLTAYLFGDLSADGKREVDTHLAACGECRARLAELRGTLDAATGALRAGGGALGQYLFEQRRLDRILAAAARRPRRYRIALRNGFIGTAALVLLALAAFWFTKPAVELARRRAAGPAPGSGHLAETATASRVDSGCAADEPEASNFYGAMERASEAPVPHPTAEGGGVGSITLHADRMRGDSVVELSMLSVDSVPAPSPNEVAIDDIDINGDRDVGIDNRRALATPSESKRLGAPIAGPVEDLRRDATMKQKAFDKEEEQLAAKVPQDGASAPATRNELPHSYSRRAVDMEASKRQLDALRDSSPKPEAAPEILDNKREARMKSIGGRAGEKDLSGRYSAADEERARAYFHYKSRDPKLTVESFEARAISIPPPVVGDEGLGQERFRARYRVNPFVDTQRDHLSTFAMDVDTASYTRTRGLLRAGRLPDPTTVRVEEFVNFFRRDHVADPTRAFSVFCEGGPAPFGASHEQHEITVKARELALGERRNAILTFAIDASGSMALEHRLEQVKSALAQLLASAEIRPDDRIAIVAYGAQPYLLLPHTAARERERILGAIGGLAPGGSTNVEAGLDLAYRLADEAFHLKAQNRVILCTDGVATAGARGAEQILERVQVFARRGIYLSIAGFGRRQYNDAFLERIANQGNGNYSYVDSREEAARVFQSSLPATLHVLARDAKIQVEFNPEVVSHYRLLGYENRDIRDQDFRNDAVDAGEVGPGSTVTALYEIRRRPASHGDLGTVRLRYHDTSAGRVDELSFPLHPGVLATRLADTSDSFRFIAAAAELAELLRGSYWTRDGSYGRVLELLASLGPEFRARPECQELAELVTRAQALTMPQLAPQAQ